MKILILSQDSWNKTNSFGNTYSNIFGSINNVEIAHVYLTTGLPDKESVVTHYYQIPENEVLKSCVKPWKDSKGAGHTVVLESNNNETTDATPGNTSNSLYYKGRHKTWICNTHYTNYCKYYRNRKYQS